MFFASDFLQDVKMLLFIFDFLNLKMICPSIVLGGWHLFCLVFFELLGSVVQCLTLIWGKFQSFLFQILMFFSFPLLLVFPLHVYYSLVVPQPVGALFSFFQSLFSLLFSFGGYHCCVLKLRDSFLSYVKCHKPMRRCLHFCYMFLISSIPFWFCIRISSLCLHCTSVLGCCLLYP